MTQRGELTADVPGRSSDPARYRDVIVTVAEWVLAASSLRRSATPTTTRPWHRLLPGVVR